MQIPRRLGKATAPSGAATRLRARTARRLRARTARSRGFVSVGVAGVLLVGGLAVALGSPNRSRVVSLLDGNGWLVNDAKGQVVQANGSSGNLDVVIPAGRPHDGLQVVVSGQDAEIYDGTSGALGALDLGSFQVTSLPSVPAGAADQIVGAAGIVYVVEPSKGVVQAIDPVTRQVLAGFVAGRGFDVLSPAVADDAGNLYVVDETTGSLLQLGLAGTRLALTRQTPVSAKGHQVDLSVVNGQPAVLDRTSGVFFVVAGGVPGPAVVVHPPAGATPLLPSSVSGSVVPIAMSGAGSVTLVSGTHATSVELPGRTLGAPVVFDGRIYVPDQSTGQAVVLSGGRVSRSIPVGGSSIQAYTEGGYLWLNDPGGSHAVAVAPGGGTQQIDKYAPAPSPPKPKPKPAPTPTTVPKTGPSGGSHHGPKPPGPTPPPPVPAPPVVKPQKPVAPVNLTATPGNGEVTLTWAEAPPVGATLTGFQISWGGPWQPFGTATSEVIGSLQNGGSGYVFSVRACDSLGCGPAARSQRVWPTSKVPSAVSGLVATALPDGSVSLSWSAAHGNGYGISRYVVMALTGGQEEVLPVHPSGLSVDVGAQQGIAIGTTYRFEVEAVNDLGTAGPASPPSKAVTPHTPPLAVDNLTVTTDGPGTILATWSCDTTCRSGGRIRRFQVAVLTAGSSTATPEPSVAPGSPSYSDPISGLQQNTTYEVQVTAVSGVGTGETTTSPAVTTIGPPQVSVTGFSVTNDVAGQSGNGPDDAQPQATITFSLNPDGSSITSCSVSSSGGSASPSGCTSGPSNATTSYSVSLPFPNWNTPYTVTVSIVTAAGYFGTVTAAASENTGPKNLTVNASPWFAPCPGTYCGGNAHSFPTPNFVANSGTLHTQGTGTTAVCWTTGGTDTGTGSPAVSSNVWIETTFNPDPWMNDLYFPDSNGGAPDADSYLPHC